MLEDRIVITGLRGDLEMEFDLVPSVGFGNIVYIVETMIENGYTRCIDLSLKRGDHNSTLYVVDDDICEAVERHVSVGLRRDVIERIYSVVSPFNAMYAAEVILASKGVFMEEGYLGID